MPIHLVSPIHHPMRHRYNFSFLREKLHIHTSMYSYHHHHFHSYTEIHSDTHQGNRRQTPCINYTTNTSAQSVNPHSYAYNTDFNYIYLSALMIRNTYCHTSPQTSKFIPLAKLLSHALHFSLIVQTFVVVGLTMLWSLPKCIFYSILCIWYIIYIWRMIG